MARPFAYENPSQSRLARLSRALMAFVFATASFALLPAAMASAATSSIGVFVDQPTTTLPPPTTVPPTTLAPATTVPPTTSAPTTVPTTSAPTTVPQPATTLPVAEDTLPDVLPQPQVPVKEESGLVSGVKSVAKSTKKVVSDVISGKPVADAIQDVLPPDIAEVVVPAVRTASTFVFPIGLAGAVVAFLALQQRIDASDPKLSAAPLAHDDDVVKFL